MLRFVTSWFHKYFSDEEAVVLFFILIAGLLVIMFFGQMLAPVLASIVIAYILQGLVYKLMRLKVPESVAIGLTFVFFMGLLVVSILGLFPLIWGQVSALVKEFPRMFEGLQASVLSLHDRYPQIVSETIVNQLLDQISAEVGKYGQTVLSFSLKSIPNVIAVLIYAVLLPILVFFFLKDRKLIVSGLTALLPSDRKLMKVIWVEMNAQFANYIRGKSLEILIVGGATYIAFVIFGLNYAALLALLVGLSVVIPYIGAAVVTIPVAMIAYFQWGWESEFVYLMLVYGVIQALDGNVLVPLLFSEVVDLHPVLIIVAVLFFGGVWGFWGVFFAIPLATLLKAVLMAWPRGGAVAT
ncbi:MAG: AI-2E family transporter [Hahellaceae bacterium]|nr:AI-2E family transporter [Hahellaceae bacterium]MCP5212027.1 AI-2E family transporter [Hahellaceae bacterium]